MPFSGKKGSKLPVRQLHQRGKPEWLAHHTRAVGEADQRRNEESTSDLSTLFQGFFCPAPGGSRDLKRRNWMLWLTVALLCSGAVVAVVREIKDSTPSSSEPPDVSDGDRSSVDTFSGNSTIDVPVHIRTDIRKNTASFRFFEPVPRRTMPAVPILPHIQDSIFVTNNQGQDFYLVESYSSEYPGSAYDLSGARDLSYDDFFRSCIFEQLSIKLNDRNGGFYKYHKLNHQIEYGDSGFARHVVAAMIRIRVRHPYVSSGFPDKKIQDAVRAHANALETMCFFYIKYWQEESGLALDPSDISKMKDIFEMLVHSPLPVGSDVFYINKEMYSDLMYIFLDACTETLKAIEDEPTMARYNNDISKVFIMQLFSTVQAFEVNLRTLEQRMFDSSCGEECDEGTSIALSTSCSEHECLKFF